MKDYDGFYLVPGAEGSLDIKYFKYKDPKEFGEKKDHTDVGDMYHVAFFRKHDDEHLVFEEHFEAIFADPLVYVKGLSGGRIFGTFLRKSERSNEFWEDYLNDVRSRAKTKLIGVKL